MNEKSEAMAAEKATEEAVEHVQGMPAEQRIELDRRLRRKFDLRVLPFCTLMHLCSMIDRANMGNAKVLGLQEDLGLTGNQFNIAMSVFYITYIVFEM